jgi:peptidyl-prolyl cis-trans isomerase D
VDRNGLDPQGPRVGSFPQGANPLTGAFGSDVGVENEPMQIPGGGYLWYEVTKITPARERTLDEVRAEVEERWRNAEVSKLLQAKATELLDKVKGGASLNDAVAGIENLPVQTTFGLKRSGNTGNTVSSRVIDAVFRVAKDEAGMAEGGNPGEWVVFRVTDITVPDFDANSDEGKRIVEAARRSLSEDVIAQYVQRLQTDLGATINQTALRQVVSGSTQQ